MWPQQGLNHFELSQSANMVTDAMAGANRIYHRAEWQKMVRGSDQDEYDYGKEITTRTEHLRKSQERFAFLETEVPRRVQLIISARDLIRNNAERISQMKLELVKLQQENRSLSQMHV